MGSHLCYFAERESLKLSLTYGFLEYHKIRKWLYVIRL